MSGNNDEDELDEQAAKKVVEASATPVTPRIFFINVIIVSYF